MPEDAAKRIEPGIYGYRGFTLHKDGRQGWALFGEMVVDGKLGGTLRVRTQQDRKQTVDRFAVRCC